MPLVVAGRSYRRDIAQSGSEASHAGASREKDVVEALLEQRLGFGRTAFHHPDAVGVQVLGHQGGDGLGGAARERLPRAGPREKGTIPPCPPRQRIDRDCR